MNDNINSKLFGKHTDHIKYALNLTICQFKKNGQDELATPYQTILDEIETREIKKDDTSETLKIIVASSANFNDYEILKIKLNAYIKDKQNKQIELICRKTLDKKSIVKRYAKEHNIPLAQFMATPDDDEMLMLFNQNETLVAHADTLIAFWDGESLGTEHLIDLANNKGLNVLTFKYMRLR